MKKYAKIINNETMECEVGLGTNFNFYKQLGMCEQDVEQGYDGRWYVSGYVPTKPNLTYAEKRAAAYPPLADQLDMIYWDKVNQTNKWSDAIKAVKLKYPKN